MKFFIYSTYDPEVESFDSRLSLTPLDPESMGEQFRRAYLKMDEQNKAFMSGKKAIFLGEFDDETGKITQRANHLEVFEFKDEKLTQVEGESEDKKECQENLKSTEN